MKALSNWKMLGALLIGGVLLSLVLMRPNEEVSGSRAGGLPATEKIEWFTALDRALKVAKETGKPVMIDFFATWCGPCKMLDSTTYQDGGVVGESRNWIMVRIDVDLHAEVAQRFGIRSIPTIVVLSADGAERARRSGFVEAKGMIQMMQSLRKS